MAKQSPKSKDDGVRLSARLRVIALTGGREVYHYSEDRRGGKATHLFQATGFVPKRIKFLINHATRLYTSPP